jgi:hypothetical protein
MSSHRSAVWVHTVSVASLPCQVHPNQAHHPPVATMADEWNPPRSAVVGGFIYISSRKPIDIYRNFFYHQATDWMNDQGVQYCCPKSRFLLEVLDMIPQTLLKIHGLENLEVQWLPPVCHRVHLPQPAADCGMIKLPLNLFTWNQAPRWLNCAKCLNLENWAPLNRVDSPSHDYYESKEAYLTTRAQSCIQSTCNCMGAWKELQANKCTCESWMLFKALNRIWNPKDQQHNPWPTTRLKNPSQ